MESTPQAGPRYLRVKEVAARYSICEATVRRWIKQGVLKASKINGVVLVAEADLPAVAGANVIQPTLSPR
jgi:excisionase family DNA binding protein